MEASCAQLLAEYHSLKTKMRQASMLPLTIIGAVGALLGKATSSATDLLNSALGILSGSVWDMTQNDMISMLSSLLDCMFIADSEMGPVIAGAVSDIEGGREISDAARSMLKSQARGQFGDVLDSLESTPFGKLTRLNSDYAGMVAKNGIPAALSAMSRLEQCLQDMCGWQSSGQFDAQHYRDKLGVAVDNKIKHVSDSVEGYPSTVVENSKAFSSAYTSLKSQIDSKTYGIIH